MSTSAVSTVIGVGRRTVFLVGLAVILAATFGAASAAFGTTGQKFILGRANNTAENPTGLVSTLADATKSALIVNNKSGGPALDLRVGSTTTPANDVAPMKVNSTKKVANLNADRLDDREASSFADGVGGVATNADKLDDLDSSDFAPSAVEPWHEVGQTGEPAFLNGWQNLGDTRTATAAFYKDPWGVVHLKGTVRSGTQQGIFLLPCGYGPDKDQNFTVVSPGANTANLGVLDIVFESCGGGMYIARVNAAQSSATAFSLNGVSFRVAGP